MKGFTLVELVITIALFAILAAVAVPNYKSFIASQRVKAAAHELLVAAQYARSEAVKRNRPTILRALGDDWNNGWEVVDSVALLQPLQQWGAPAGVEIDAEVNDIRLLNNGRADLASAEIISVCDVGRVVGVSRREFRIDMSGLSNVTRPGDMCSDDADE